MGCLVAITGAGAAFWLLIMLILVGEVSDPDARTVLLFFEAIHLFPFLFFLKKYRSPEYKAKKKKAREKMEAQKAAAKEIKRQMEEDQRRATTVVSTRLVGASAPEYKKSVGDMAVRGAVGGLFGPAGAVIGMATAKEKDVNKRKRRFLVKYEDGHIEEKEASVGDPFYKLYMEHLEWD